MGVYNQTSVITKLGLYTHRKFFKLYYLLICHDFSHVDHSSKTLFLLIRKYFKVLTHFVNFLSKKEMTVFSPAAFKNITADFLAFLKFLPIVQVKSSLIIVICISLIANNIKYFSCLWLFVVFFHELLICALMCICNCLVEIQFFRSFLIFLLLLYEESQTM